MRTRPKLVIMSAALALGAVAAPLVGDRAAANDHVITVQRGQTLSEIAVREGVSVAQLIDLNDLRDPNRIFAGQRLRVRPEPAAPATPAPAAAATTHRVAFGETLTGIAARYRTTIAAIARANGIANASYIRTGQLLTIPGAPATAPATPAPAAPATTHRVAFGETLTGIAARYRTTIAAIARANGIANASYIWTGQLLTIPGAPVPASSTERGGATPGAPNAAMPAAMARLVAKRQPIARLIVAEAERQGVPAAFALAVAWQESGWQPAVVSSAGAIGIMQLLPATGEWVGGAMLGHAVDLRDPAANVRAGVRLLKHYLQRYGGSRSLVLAAYYQGQTAADRHGVYPVTRPYIASIVRLESLFAS